MIKPMDYKNMLISVFKKNGSSGKYTDVWDDISPDVKAILGMQVALKENELFIIGSIKSASIWTLVTTQRVIWKLDADSNELNVKDVRDAVINLSESKSDILRHNLQFLEIKTFSNNVYKIPVEDGFCMGGMWNVLRRIGSYNRSSLKNEATNAGEMPT